MLITSQALSCPILRASTEGGFMHSGSLVASHTNKQKRLEGVWADSPIRRAVQIGQRGARKVGSAESSRSSGSLSRSGVPSF